MIEKRRRKHVRLTYQTKYLQIQREFGRVALPWVRSNKKTQNYRYQNYCLGWQYSNLFIWPSMWTRLEHAHCLETINKMWFLGKRESFSAWSLTIICCWQVQDYIYWIISTENYHRHYHKFIKYIPTTSAYLVYP
jgi:hypothetical protein